MKLDLASERDEWMAAKAMTTHYVQDKECTPARAIVRQALEIERLRGEAELLRNVLAQVAQTHAWLAFGECRSFGTSTPLLNSQDADKLAKITLKGTSDE